MLEIFYALILFYIIDSVIHVAKYHYCLGSILGPSTSIKKHGLYLNSLFPSSTAYTLSDYPIYFSQSGILFLKIVPTYEKEIIYDEDLELLQYSAIQDIEVVGNKLTINGRRFKLQSPAQATHISLILKQILNTDKSDIKKVVKGYYEEQFNLYSIKAIKKNQNRSGDLIEFFGQFYFSILFILSPIYLFILPSHNYYLEYSIWLIAGIYLIELCFIIFLMIRKRLPYTAPSWIIPIVLYPVSLIHLKSILLRDSYVKFHFLLPLSLFCSKEVLLKHARRYVNKLQIIKNRSTSIEYISYIDMMIDNTKFLISRKYIPQKQLYTAPERQSLDANSYCPICETEYLNVRKNCTECDVLLNHF